MPLHPAAQEFLERPAIARMAPLGSASVDVTRATLKALTDNTPPGEPVAWVEDRLITGPHGDIPIRLYAPTRDEVLPVYVHFHGGGWVIDNFETEDSDCRILANQAHCLVVSVNYRHAPEHRFPCPLDDAFAATQWVASHTDELTADAHRIAVGGQSAGANLAAAVALRARDANLPLCAQILSVPVLNYAFDTDSYRSCADGYVLTRRAMEWFWSLYLASQAEGALPEVSPLRAPCLRGLPPAFIATSEFDPLRDEGAAYADRLQNAGVCTQYRCYAGMIHPCRGEQALPDVARYLRTIFREAHE